MEASIFSPSNIVIGTFQVQSIDEIPAKFHEIVTQNPAVQVDSYILASGRAWILTSTDPIQLKEGSIGTAETEEAAFAANARYLAGADRGHTDMIVGTIFIMGGIVTLVFSVAAVGGVSLWSVGAIVFGGFRFCIGLSKRMAR